MDCTFALLPYALRRKDWVDSDPPVCEALERGPALESQVNSSIRFGGFPLTCFVVILDQNEGLKQLF